jgi:membrane-anchored mycosin MYCP
MRKVSCSPSHQDFEVCPVVIEPLEARQMLSGGGGGRHHKQVAAPPAPAANWVPYAKLLGQDLAATYFPGLTGKGVGVAIIDRGIDYNHPQIGASKIVAGYNFRDNNTITLDDYGHGTGVAGIVASYPFTYNGLYDQGVAPAARLIDLKQESSANIKQALDWVIANHKRYKIGVVNLTDFVAQVLPGAWDPTLYLPELQTLHDEGVFIVTPVGNGAGLPIEYPALSPYVTGAGGIDPTGHFDPDSRDGTGLTILGPAVDVTLPYYERNKSSTGYDQFDDNYDGTAVLTDKGMGTSWSAAYVAGTAALLKQLSPKLKPDQIKQILVQSGDAVTDPSTGATYPRLNIEHAIELAYATLHKKLPKFLSAAKRASSAAARPATFSTTPIAPPA